MEKNRWINNETDTGGYNSTQVILNMIEKDQLRLLVTKTEYKLLSLHGIHGLTIFSLLRFYCITNINLTFTEAWDEVYFIYSPSLRLIGALITKIYYRTDKTET